MNAETDPYAALRIRDFRLALASKFFVTLGVQMQAVILGWQIFTLTRDPLALGLIGLAEAAPFVGLALWAGHFADRHEKRAIILGAELGMLGCALAFLALAWVRVPVPWPIYAIIGFHGVCRSFLWPASTSYVEMVVPQPLYARAAGWNSTLWQVGAILGPILGGWLYAAFDAPQAYAGVVVCLGLGIWFSTRVSLRPPVSHGEDVSGWAGALQGVRFVFSQPVILGAISLDLFAVLFGGAVVLLPIFAEMLQAGPDGLGVLRAAPSVGALAMALYLSHRPPFERTGRVLLWGVSIFGLSMIGFALSPLFLVSFLWLAISGAADNISVVVRASILQATTPNHLRGRVSSVNGVFVGSSNEIGAFESGVAAKLMGVVPSVIVGGCMTLISVAVTAWRAPALRRLGKIRQCVI